MTRKINISDESLGLLEHMSPLKIDDVILMFAKTYIGIADSLRGEKETQVVEDIHSGSKLAPALGESWTHATTTRLLMSHEDSGYIQNSCRRCTLIKLA